MANSATMAEFRFSVIGHLLASPPHSGQLQTELKNLSEKHWKHPTSGERVQFSLSTIERWYYQALKSGSAPIAALRSKTRSDFNKSKVFTEEIRSLLQKEILQHPGWSKQLHADNLKVIVENKNLGKAPSYSTVKKYLRKIGYLKRSAQNSKREGYRKSQNQKSHFEQRSYEHPYVGSLFHLDFHVCSREIITSSGEIIYPRLFGVIDDCSRLICHCQWYLAESTENLVHGFTQALQKRGLPRALMSDNGSAMTSREFTSGLKNLGIIHETTLPYSPEQNGKQEVFWGQVEGRFMKLIENRKNITLKELNEHTQAWVEMEYNRKIHRETKSTPLQRYLSFKGVIRTCPSSQELRNGFRRIEKRKVRRTDGTISLCGKRFEVPQRFRHFSILHLQFGEWDLSNIHIVDENTHNILGEVVPLNKIKNALEVRRETLPLLKVEINPADAVAPLMTDLLKKYEETGLPFSYQAKDE